MLAKGWTTRDVADVLGSSEAIITRHYAQWTDRRQERIWSLAQDVWNVSFLSGSKIKSVTVDSEMLNLVDGMGLEDDPGTEKQ